MKMKLPRKLLSCLLVLAICATTVFGCLITVNAAAASYAFGEVKLDNPAQITKATVPVTFTPTLDNAYAVSFLLSETGKDADNCLVLDSVTTGNADVTISIETEEVSGNEIAYVMIDSEKEITSITLNLVFSFSAGDAKRYHEYKASISEVTYADRHGKIATDSAVVECVIDTGCDHEIVVDQDSLVKTDTVNGYSVYSKSYCSLCKEEFDYQVVPVALPHEENIIWWDGTTKQPTTDINGDGVIEVNTAAELYWLASNNVAAGTKYIVADGIDAIILQPEAIATVDADENGVYDIMELKTWRETKAYYEALEKASAAIESWSVGLDSATKTTFTFGGSFDGNGVAIYGLYYNKHAWSESTTALFPFVGVNATIKNLAVRGAYLAAQSFEGAIAGTSVTGSSDSDRITVDTVEVSNCWIYNTENTLKNNGTADDPSDDYINYFVDRSGVMFGGVKGLISVNNCLVYGNMVTNADNKEIPYAFGSLNNKWTTEAINHSYSNSIILDAMPFKPGSWNAYQAYSYKNMYTNADLTQSAHYSEYTDETKIKKIDASDVKGENAETIVNTFNTAAGSTVWAVDVNGGYPTFAKEVGVDTVADTSSAELALKAVNLTYNPNGSFNLNFHYEPSSEYPDAQMYVAQTDLSGFMKLEAEPSSMANNGLSPDAVMYVVKNLSAREIGDTLLPTMVAASGSTAVWGKTEKMSIKDYAIDVINGKAFYSDATDETTIEKDKNVAAAVINYGEAAKKALTQGYDGSAGGKTIYWDGNKTAPTEQVDGTYIINTAEELAYVAYNATTGNYKIADDIGTIIMQPEETIEAAGGASKLMSLSSYEETKTYFENLKAKSADLKSWVTKGSSNCFLGTFDGNGVDIYGLYYNDSEFNSWSNCALFPAVGYSATIKNVAVKNSYIVAWSYAAALVGYAEGYINSVANNGTVHIDNCEVANCYIGSGHNSYRAGVMLGAVGSEVTVKTTAEDGTETEEKIKFYIGISVNNCLVYGNKAISKMIPGTNAESGLYGSLSNFNTATEADYSVDNQIENSIILDCTPYQVDGGANATLPANFNKVYTNVVSPKPAIIHYPTWLGLKTSDDVWAKFSDKIFVLDDVTKAKGSAAAANMPNLDWSKWSYGMSGEYPTPITSVVASDEKVISCYSGTPATSFKDTVHDGSSPENAIVISSADELAYLANGADGNTAGLYYEIDSSVDAMVLQAADYADAIMALSSAEEVKTYFETNAPTASKQNWAEKATNTCYFDGTLNGNGVTIYGMYSTKWNLYGLFPYASDITLENIAIKNCYVKGDKAGVIVGYAPTAGTITLNNCEVANNVTITSRFNDGMANGGVLIGNVQDTANGYTNSFLTVDNCVIYGNIATHTASETQTDQNAQISTTATYDTNYGLYGVVKGNSTDKAAAKISNSIILDTLPFVHNAVSSQAFTDSTFENVYTNMLGQTYVNTNYNTEVKTYILGSTVNDDGTVVLSTGGESTATRTLAAGSLISVSASDVLGDNAKVNASALGWADNGGVWYAGNVFNYPSLTESTGVMPAANQGAFDGLALTNYDNYASTDPEFSVYATSLNLKTNPYIAFTFAFNGTYKENRKNITVTFKNASGKTIATTTVADANDNLNPGWTNNTGAGRYHLYRLTDVAVEDLCNDITVTVSYGGKSYEFGTFSVEGFALDIQNAYKQDSCQYYSTRVEAAKALLYYTQMIYARYGSEE